jgi:hypothetical protein
MLKDLSIAELLYSFSGFVSEGSGASLSLRQLQAAGAILDSICRGRGQSFRLNLPLEDHHLLQNHLLSYLLRMYNHAEHTLLVFNIDPARQVEAMDRLVACLWGNIFTRGRWMQSGNEFAIDRCRVRFCYAGEPVLQGASTPDLLVLVNREQKITEGLPKAPIFRPNDGGNPTRVVCEVETIGQPLYNAVGTHTQLSLYL